jgi:ferrous iron transport protein A
MQCPLCSYEFDERAMQCHSACALNQSCAVICCPNCGYQMVDVSKSRMTMKLSGAFARLLKPPRAASNEPAHLSDLRAGQTACVLGIEAADTAVIDRLQIYGVVPGARITLQQRSPTIVFQIGYTELSVEREVARCIHVELSSP